MELVTGHGASEHITAAQVSRLIQGVTVMDDTTVYRLNVGNDCAIGVNGLTVGISTGEMVLHGYHTTFEDAETLTLDPTLDAAKSRIDKLCLIISEDLTTGIQSAYIQVVQGTESTTPTAPATPSTPTSPTELYMGVGVIATVTVSDTVIASYVDNTDLYAGSFVTLNELETNMSNIAPIEKTSTASKAYAIGDNLIYNGILYKVDAAIAQGATLVPSGNISLSPDVETQIASLRSSLSWQVLGDHVSFVVANNTEWNEANVVVIVGNDITKEVSFTLNRMIFDAVTGTYNYLNSGYGLTSSDLVTVRIGFDGTYITLNSAYDSGVNVSSTSSMMVYVR